MIWILATRGASTKLRASPFTETPITGVHSIVYKPGVEPVPFTGRDGGEGAAGTFTRGLHRVAGLVFSFHGSVAETLLATPDGVDLVVRYRANAQIRVRTFGDVIFIGDAVVTFPGRNTGLAGLIGVPFRVQIPDGDTLADHITDALDT
ncbi:MAG: hypothetical protein ACE5E6_11245 [Phycisphaerae bacterium]